MAHQPWNLGGGTLNIGQPLKDAHDGPAVTKTPADVVLLGPDSQAKPAPPTPRLEPKAAERHDPRPAPASYMPAPRRGHHTRRTVLGLSALVLVCVGIPSIAYLRSSAPSPAAPAPVAPSASGPVAAAAPNMPTGPAGSAGPVMGTATVISRPEGAQVFIDGTVRGVTPLTLTLPLGSYTLQLQHGSQKRSLPLVVESGFVVRQYVELGAAAGDVTMGRLDISSDPAGAAVSVDGVARGVTPLSLASIEPGQHRVTIAGAEGTVNRTVNVAAGASASVVVTLGAVNAAAGGWVTVTAPFELQILENGQVIGSSAMDRLMLPAGKHDLTLRSEAFGFTTTSTVQVPAGRTVAVPVTLPKGTLSINALPWAEVLVDGEPAGTTPLGNLSVTVGNHEITWRHPQLGERRQVIKVTGGAPVRASVDFNK